MHQQDKDLDKKIRAEALNDPEHLIEIEGAKVLSGGDSRKMDHHKHLLVSSPVDPQFEMLVVGCTINLLDSLKNSKFRGPVETDLEMLKDPKISSRKRTALTNRVGQK